MICEVTRRENKHKVGKSPAIPHIFGIPRKQNTKRNMIEAVKSLLV
jgi:hypothetical protein